MTLAQVLPLCARAPLLYPFCQGLGYTLPPPEGAKLARELPERPHLQVIPASASTPAPHLLCHFKETLEHFFFFVVPIKPFALHWMRLRLAPLFPP